LFFIAYYIIQDEIWLISFFEFTPLYGRDPEIGVISRKFTQKTPL